MPPVCLKIAEQNRKQIKEKQNLEIAEQSDWNKSDQRI